MHMVNLKPTDYLEMKVIFTARWILNSLILRSLIRTLSNLKSSGNFTVQIVRLVFAFGLILTVVLSWVYLKTLQ
jgi:hypothetical protein